MATISRYAMTESEWKDCTDAGAMIDFLWQQRGISPHYLGTRVEARNDAASALRSRHAELERALHRFYLASCRGIFPLLPDESSREGVLLGERFLQGEVDIAALKKFTWYTEAAAFGFNYDEDSEFVAPLIETVRAIPPADLRSMLHPPAIADEIDTRELLKRAAYFADYSMIYPLLMPKGPPPDDHRIFLSARLLREYVTYTAHADAESGDSEV